MSFKFFLGVGAILVLIFETHNEVNAAPCLWMLDKPHQPPTTVKPELVEEFNSLKHKTGFPLDKLTEWMLWGPRSESQKKPPSRNPLEKIISSYIKFIANVLNL